MKHIHLFISIIVIFFASSAIFADSMTIGIIHVEKIASAFKQKHTKSLRQNSRIQNHQERLQHIRGDLQKYRANLQDSGQEISEEKRNLLQRKLHHLKRKLRKEHAQVQREILIAKRKLKNSFRRNISQAAAKIARDKKLKIVVPARGIFFAEDKVDITDDVILILQKNNSRKDNQSAQH